MKNYDVAAFVWPAYTGDEKRARIFWEKGIGEWQTVMNASPESNGQTWPRKPLWGYVNEADPFVMEMEIEAASRHGINTFIYDWYWYDGRPFLENCLNDGFLKAANNKKMKFYLMWANHDATTLWDMRNSHDTSVPIWTGTQTPSEFEKTANYIAEKYFVLENYYKIDGQPVFMIYDTASLLKGFGGPEEAEKGLKKFNEMVTKYGFDGIHLQYVKTDFAFERLKREFNLNISEREMLKRLGFSSITHYQFIHFMDMRDMTYADAIEKMKKEWEACEKFDIPYYPHVSLGWDPNPRFKEYNPNVLKNPDPKYAEKAFRLAKDYVDAHAANAPLIVVNSWNEWTEGSYFEPDNIYGYGYLDAAKRVFLNN